MLSSLAYAETKELTLDEFNAQINKASSEEQYRSSIIKQDGLHTLLIVPNETAESESGIDGETFSDDANNASTPDTTSGKTPAAESNTDDGLSTDNKSPALDAPLTEILPKADTDSLAATGVVTEQRLNPSPVSTSPSSTSLAATGVVTEQRLNPSPVSTSPSSTATPTPVVTLRKSVVLPAVKPTKTAEDDFYFPSAISNNNNDTIAPVSVTFNDTKVKFGISIGTAIPIRLRRTSTNVQPGYIELVTLTDMPGRKKILPAGSIIFSRPSVVKGSSRLYLNTVRGVTPEGDEFFILGHVSDSFNTAGLTGIIKSDGRALERSATAGALALGGSLASELADGVIGLAASTAANQMITEGSAQSKASLDKAAFIISSNPQEGTLTVEQTF
ncbi:MAG: hypothetical protein GY820_43460 [Gammaproteobacteria bacterium]|nr:hypothetical protein [Gammaproteobacteria bacterium]